MDPTIAQYATLAANLGLAGFMAVMLLTWYNKAQERERAEATERKDQAKLEAEKCRACMEQHREDLENLLDRVLAQGQETVRFMETVSHSLATSRRMDQIEKLLEKGKDGSSDTRRPHARD